MITHGGRKLPSMQRALLIIPIWIFCTVWMWTWWLNSDRVAYSPLFIPITLAMLYEYLILPSVFLYFVLRVKIPRRRFAQKGAKVAVISLCVPDKESMGIIEVQLKAMSEVTYPHDSWILDEGNSNEVKRLASKYGVRHFSRKGITKYNQSRAPFKAKTKAGNVNAWISHVRRYKYEFFVQLDIDHNPKPDYLDKTLGYFKEPGVGWVQAPSVYKNLTVWTARASAEQELVLQGPLQMGFYGHSEIPFIIGSHSTYRMSAIQEIGGFQPTRAEDHLDTLALANKGWKGVFLPEIIAKGDGPETLNTYLAQQFAWAYSMFQVLIHYSPKLLNGLPLKAKLQFLFSQTWYPLWSMAYLVMFLTPVIALFIDRSVAHLTVSAFILHFFPMFISTFLVWWTGRPLMQPKGLRLSWRGILLHSIRWPVVLLAVLNAAFNVKRPYMITPKGKRSRFFPSAKVYGPFLVLSGISSLAILFYLNKYPDRKAAGQIVFAAINQFFMLAICLVDLNIRIRQASGKLRKNFYQYWMKPVSVVATAAIFTVATLSIALVSNQSAVAVSTPPENIDTKLTGSVPLDKLSIRQITQQLSSSQILISNDIAPKLGIFDPRQQLKSAEPYIRHSFLDWRNPLGLAKQLYIDEQLNAVPLITLMPAGEPNGQLLLQDIISGKYDDQLNNLFSIISSSKNTIYIRFAHEMDLANLYPWGNQDPSSFIAAYRHVVLLSRDKQIGNVKWVWSPAGNDNAAGYYPGSDAVDIVGTTILYDSYWYGSYQPSFFSISSQRRWLQQYNKPVWIVEFGAGNADPDFQLQLVQDALEHFQSYGYAALIYLNTNDSNTNGPDYRLQSIQSFNPNVIADRGSYSVYIAPPVHAKNNLKPKTYSASDKQELRYSLTSGFDKLIAPAYSSKPTFIQKSKAINDESGQKIPAPAITIKPLTCSFSDILLQNVTTSTGLSPSDTLFEDCGFRPK